MQEVLVAKATALGAAKRASQSPKIGGKGVEVGLPTLFCKGAENRQPVASFEKAGARYSGRKWK